VHAAAIAGTCKTLAELVSGGIKESRAGKASWTHIAVDDFVPFCEWAYRGDYTMSLRKKKPRGTKDTKDPKDCDCTFCSHLGENLTSLLLAHARLYVFANLYRIESLNKLVASKIQKILSNPNPCTCHIQGVLALARYVYSDDAYMPDRDECDRLDYLRSVVMTSVVELTKMGHYVLFLPFLEEEGCRLLLVGDGA
jgi:hypothetical protein